MANTFMDLQHNAQATALLDVSQRTSQTTGSGVNIPDVGTNVVSAILVVGAATGTSPTQDIKIQESSDNSTWTDAKAPDQTTADFATVSSANQIQVITFLAQKPYVRAYAAAPGGSSTPGYTYGVYLLAQKKLWGAPTGGWVNDGTAGSYA